MFERYLRRASTPRFAAWLAVCLAGALLGAGCNDNKEAPFPEVKPPVNIEGVHDLNDAQLDTLRAMKNRLKITRDEYWDDRGGVLANEHFEVWYPPGKVTVSHGMYVFDFMEKSRGEINALFGRVPEDKLTVVCSQTMEAYTKATERQWWNYSRIDEHRITFQPVAIMVARGIVNIALPREYYEWALRRIGNGRLPLWIVEGLASDLADEWSILQDNLGEFPDQPVRMSVDDMEKALEEDNDRMRARFAYYNAFRMVDHLTEQHGRDKLVALILAVADGDRPEKAAETAYGVSWDGLLSDAAAWELELEDETNTDEGGTESQ